MLLKLSKPQEYLNLFNSNLMSAEELNKIKEIGLNELSHYKSIAIDF